MVDDQTLLTGSRDRTIKQWNVATGECIQSIDFVSPVQRLLMLKKNSELFVCGLDDGTIEVRTATDVTL